MSGLGKVSGADDVLRPSRLLLRCSDAQLPGRALRLFHGTAAASIAPECVPFQEGRGG